MLLASLDQRFPVDQDELQNTHTVALNKARALFKKEAGFESGDLPRFDVVCFFALSGLTTIIRDLEPFMKDLEDAIEYWSTGVKFEGGECIQVRSLTGGLFHSLIAQNSEASRKVCGSALN